MPAAEAAPLDILYDDPYLLAVNKPAGIVVHPTYKHDHGTLLNALMWRARDWPPPMRPSILGRLDKLTSGVTLVAKTADVHAALQRTLASRASRKEYLAVVYGSVSPASGAIALALRHEEGDRRRMVAACDPKAAPSITEYERRAAAEAPRAGLALLRCRLVTGRRHQIRAHLAAAGWPVVGDAVYGEPRWVDVDDRALADRLSAFPRQALHAAAVEFRHPVLRTRMRIEAPMPEDLLQLVAAIWPDGAWARD